MCFHLLTKSCGVNCMCLSPFIRLYKKTHPLGTGLYSQPAFCSNKPTQMGRLVLLLPSRFDCARLALAPLSEDQLLLSPLVVVAVWSVFIAVCQAGRVVPPVDIEPVQQGADACRGQCNDVVCAAVV